MERNMQAISKLAENEDEEVQLDEDQGAGNSQSTEGDKKFDASVVLNCRKMKSKVWKFFFFKGTSDKGPDKSRVICKLCEQSKRGKIGSIPYISSTTNLMNHLKVWHPKECKKEKTEEEKKADHNKNRLSLKVFLISPRMSPCGRNQVQTGKIRP